MVDKFNQIFQGDDQSKDKVILVVDDDEISRKILYGILYRLWYKIDEADDWRKALFLIEIYKSKLLCVVLDYQMPDMTWLQVAEQLKLIWCEVETIMVTWNTIEKAILEKLWINLCLKKPLTPDSINYLLEHVKNLSKRKNS